NPDRLACLRRADTTDSRLRSPAPEGGCCGGFRSPRIPQRFPGVVRLLVPLLAPLGAREQLAEALPLAAKASAALFRVSTPDPGAGAGGKVSFGAAGELRKAGAMG